MSESTFPPPSLPMTDPRPTQNAAASPLSEERVREYEQMLSAVTPGPWEVAGPNDRECHAEGDILAPNIQPTRGLDRRVLAQLNRWYPSSADARFIAASPTIVRDLLSDRDALSARVAELERDARAIDAIERGEIEIDFMGTTTRYFNVYRPDGDLSTTADGTSLRAAFDRVLNPPASR